MGGRSTLPMLAITLGDVAGIGPEVTVKLLLNHPALRQRARFVVIGDGAALQAALDAVLGATCSNATESLGGKESSSAIESSGATGVIAASAGFTGLDGSTAPRLRQVQHPSEVQNQPGTIEYIQVGEGLGDVPLGRVNARAGAAAAQFVIAACELARQGAIDGIVTAPLNKEAMHLGGYDWPGHTELLAHEFSVKNYSLVLSNEDLFVFHATTHVSMRQAVEDCTAARFDEILDLVHAFAKALGRGGEAIAVAGLNPHASENDLFGTEESQIIVPAIARARQRGIHVVGPLPGDVIWPQAVREKKWRFLICCYHDQGHAPFKAVYGDQGVNITVGLPVVRVSVDHGTAFDIAGQNVAREDSLVMAAERAADLAPGWSAIWSAAQQGA